ncbi:dihydropteroate synthase [Zooshikella marina]|uniref:Dihydropteroate synthase n=2 Tax=Zooshikella ganghwensis TaxID=202772 RepID=A0A4P9VSF4_9GAMM|nr:dihydropteroate synthase [Zooshikella ganghwensis]MBU2707980.1 dihydropteroate synthase [Zooshikella ganghwensis]RDH45789.1 dihydropteroate synthase [Zooshikella ganghwensis]
MTTSTLMLSCGDKVLDLSTPQVMGILNVTPDSFSDGGQYSNFDKALQHAEKMICAGASIIDIGGESTRPGANPVTVQAEMDRVLPVLSALKQHFDVIISVDTSSPELMREAAQLGAGMINDVRALKRDNALTVAADLTIPICLMHMLGEPDTMQRLATYDDVVDEVISYLQQRVAACIEHGIEKQRLLIDPGFGFSKTLEHNLLLLKRLDELQRLELPLLVGLSRKRMIGDVLGKPVSERLYGSLALAAWSVLHGAHIIRVHDVAETVDVVRMLNAIQA